MTNLRCYHIGYYINRYAKWYRIESFVEPIDMIRWLMKNADSIDGNIDFISYKVM